MQQSRKNEEQLRAHTIDLIKTCAKNLGVKLDSKMKRGLNALENGKGVTIPKSKSEYDTVMEPMKNMDAASLISMLQVMTFMENMK